MFSGFLLIIKTSKEPQKSRRWGVVNKMGFIGNLKNRAFLKDAFKNFCFNIVFKVYDTVLCFSKIKSKRVFHLHLMDYITKNRRDFSPNQISFKILKYLFKLSFGNGHIFSIKLDVNNRCNQKCKFCYLKKGSEELDLKHIFNLIDNLKTGSRVGLMGGEPLLRKEIFDIIKYIKKKNLTCSLFTNATLISKKKASDLKKVGLNLAIVTLSSDSESVHDSLTQVKGSWKKTVQGIKNLVERGIKTYTHTVITSKNIDRIEGINEFSRELGATPLFFRYIPKTKKDTLAVKDNKAWKRVRTWVLYKKSPGHGKVISRMLELGGRSCFGGVYMLSVKSNGDVTPCPFIDDLIIGNIKNKNIQGIYENRFKVKEFLEFSSPSKECISCSLVKLCNSGCKAANKTLFGNYNRIDYQCLGPWSTKPPFKKICEYTPYWW